MGPGSHITISNAPHHYSVCTKTLSSPTHNLMSLILHHFSFFHSDWQCVRYYFQHYIVMRSPYSMYTTVYTEHRKTPHSNKKPLSMMEVTIARIHIRKSALLCAFIDRTEGYESQTDIKRPK